MSTPGIPIESSSLSRDRLRAQHLALEIAATGDAIAAVKLDETARGRIRDHAAKLAIEARQRAQKDGFALSLIHRFGLDTPQGIALMQLTEALPRTVSPQSAHALICDKVGALSWRDAVSKTSGIAERLALNGLDVLAKIFRDSRPQSALQRAARRTLEKAIKVLGRQYVLGETLESAYRNGRKLAHRGFRFSYDMLGEAAMTDAAARDFHRSYAAAIDFLSARNRDRFTISVKLSALHPRFEERQRTHALPVLVERIKDLAIRARKAEIALTIDAEESERMELTLDVFEQLLAAPELRGWTGLGLAVQAYQRRALALLEYLEGLSQQYSARLNIRLVKGAYWDTEIKRAQQLGLSDYPIFVRKCDTDVNYLACARLLLERPRSFFPAFATHNAHTLAAVVELAAQTNNPDFEFQRLHGMGEHLHDSLLRAGYASRIYAPVGPQRELLPYLVRRLLENGASSSFVRQLTDANVPIERLTRDPVHIAATHVLSRTGVSEPTSVFNQSWSSARGYDLTSRPTSKALLDVLRSQASTAHAAPLIDGSQHVGPTRPITNPANRQHIAGVVVEASIEHVELAVAAARNACIAWSRTAAQARAKILEKAAKSLEERAPEFIRLAVLEAGKTLDDAIGEIREAIDFCRYYAHQCQETAVQNRAPLGVVVCISPWNFPLAIFLGQVVDALSAGNTVIAKPAEQTPLIASLATRLLHDAGIPNGAMHIVPGDGRVGAALTRHRDVDGICFTGSVATAKAIAQSLSETKRASVPFIAETGGINAMIVDCSALPEQVVRDALTSAFQSAGQRCSAARILCVQSDIADGVVALLKGALEQLRVGDPALLDTDVGPLIDAEAQQQVQTYLQSRRPIASASVDAKVALQGTFVTPTLLEVARVADVDREIFGPVLHIVRYDAQNLDAVVQEINRLGYGLTLGVHTRIRGRAQSIAADAHVGNVYINRHQVGAVVGQQPFGGHGLSGTGPKAGGPHYLLRMSRPSSEQHDPSYRLELTDRALDEPLRTAIFAARAAQESWRRMSRRIERVQFVCELLAANTSHPLSGAATRVRLPDAADLSPRLGNIAGEDNTLRLRPRGILLCIDPSPNQLDTLAIQILMSIAVGNGVLAVVCKERTQELRELIAELHQIGVEENLITCIETTSTQIPKAWIAALDIDGVVFDGCAEDRHSIASLLNARSGALLPLLSSTDDIYRFGTEQTVTVNTAAAGGDPTLLALAG